MVWGAVGGGAAMGIASYMGSRKAAKAAQAGTAALLKFQQEQVNAAIKELEAVGIPSEEALTYVLQDPQLAGLEEIPPVVASEVYKIQTDPKLKQTQYEELDRLKEEAEGGMSAEAKARLAMQRQEAAGQAAARSASIKQSMAERGMMGSGQELIAQLQGGQAAAQRMQQASMQTILADEQAKREAGAKRAALAGQLEQTEFGQKATKAKSKEEFEKFNLAQRMETQRRNLERQQRMADIRMGLRHEEARGKVGAAKYRHGAQMDVAKAKAAARTGGAQMMSQTMRDQTKIAAQRAAAPYKAVGQAIGAGAQMYAMSAEGGVKKYQDGGRQPQEPMATRNDIEAANQIVQAPNVPAANIPAPPMPPAPMSQGAMAPEEMMQAPMTQPPMPPQPGMADGGYYKMGYEDGGDEGRIVPGEEYYGDELPDRINSGEMVLNVEQQDRLYALLQEYARLKEGQRVDRELENGEREVIQDNQDALMAVLRGEMHPEELPEGGITDDARRAALMQYLG